MRDLFCREMVELDNKKSIDINKVDSNFDTLLYYKKENDFLRKENEKLQKENEELKKVISK